MSNKKTKMNHTKRVLKACEQSYEKFGVQGAIDEATKQNVKTYKHCAPCDAEQPSIAGYCCVCGSRNK